MKKDKVYKIGYRIKGIDAEIGYVWTRAKNLKEAIEGVKLHVSNRLEELHNIKGAIQKNAFNKKLTFYNIPTRANSKF